MNTLLTHTRRRAGKLVLAAALALAACGEKPQTAHRKADDAPWVDNHTAYLARNYRPTDEAAWVAQLHQRAQTQNEYTRVPIKP